MGSTKTGTVESSETWHHRPRSRGVRAPARASHHSLLTRLQLTWQSLPPLARVFVAGTLLVAVAYGIVVLIVELPDRVGIAVWLWAPPLLLAIWLFFFVDGEPSDQATVHWPAGGEQGVGRPAMMSEAEFDELEDRVDRAGQEAPPSTDLPRDGRRLDPADDEADFSTLVRQAIDELPTPFVHALDHVAVVVSDQGAVQRSNGRIRPLYGLYVGYASRGPFVIGAPSGSPVPDRIVIFRDTLVHDFGNDPVQLRREVTRTLRHELAHHLGWDEEGVRALGL